MEGDEITITVARSDAEHFVDEDGSAYYVAYWEILDAIRDALGPRHRANCKHGATGFCDCKAPA